MYHDLENRVTDIKNNSVIKALCGNSIELKEIPEEINGYDHDLKSKSIDLYQVMDADSSQQDAILLSKKGVSFVLQGPPGTGKSQTITNIISEALADGKRILFVSEKMAALDVVYRRLSLSELSDFCLILHSHKANKKEVLNSLGKSLNQDRVTLKKDTLYQLDILKKEKDKLNDYVSQLHTPVSPLGMTIYEVNGHLSKLKSAPDLLFFLDNIELVTDENLRTYSYFISEFAKTMGKMSEDYNSNSWKGSSISTISHELRHNIEIRLNRLIKTLPFELKELESEFKKHSLNGELTFGEILEYIGFLNFCSTELCFSLEWLSYPDSSLDEMIEQVLDSKFKQSEYFMVLNELNAFYSEDLFQINSIEISSILSKNHNQLSKILNDKYSTEKDVFEKSENLLSICSSLKEEVELLMIVSENLSQRFDLQKPLTVGESRQFFEFIDLFCQDIRASEMWFSLNPERDQSLQNIFKKGEEVCTIIQKIKTDLLSEYKIDVLDLSYEPILSKFNGEYKSALRILNKNYRNDRNIIKSLKLNFEKNIDDKDIIILLEKLKILNENRKWMVENNSDLKEFLGGYYIGEGTDYSIINNSRKKCEKIKSYFGGEVPKSVINLLVTGDNVNLFSTELASLNKVFESNNLENYVKILRKPITKDTEFKKLLESSSLIASLISESNLLIDSIISTSNQNHDYSFYRNSLDKLSQAQESEKEFQKNNGIFEKKYLSLYNGVQTDWDKILSHLKDAKIFKDYVLKYNLSKDFQISVFSLTSGSNSIDSFAQNLKTFYDTYYDDIVWFNSLFNDEYNVLELNLYALHDRIEGCLNNLAGLEEWIDFRIAKENCEAEGLGSVIHTSLEENIDKHLLLDAFYKRFYRLWLDAALPSYPAVNRFRRRNHEETISKFTELDKTQMEIAKLRLKERLISRLPDINKITYAQDEISILKRELSKQKRIIPLRKLFANIPTLLPRLKPCFLMSPLSVSMFLQSDEYNFDMIIFDEASQICTENAVGSIIRSKQVIIAGDNKQLPPTNFFNASSTGEDFDTEDDDEKEDDHVYDSILDEALTVLPVRSLKWHYRSKHEHLIAFSNCKIYNNSLITFPSSIEKAPDIGVEYTYVEDGIYDRSGKRDNPTEAKKVAELVFNHIKNFPNRTLGVIAFSSSQQQAIESALQRMRLENQIFETFFDEEKDEPFFIKNLENVQGDERDTIIFSIGYARDPGGKMYLNFGPVSRDGGYRRLNVAITRAKYNLKLVGSIRPTDISLDTNAEGVKLLRSYIDFAISGPSVLEYGSSSNIINLESPFEESVYDFLVSEGYNIETQVGCSGYRIDLAVKHPTLDGRYVLGIECDGATYHSSRTARERDRLRQSILEEIGWKIYRVWSTDWIKDQKTESDRLKKAVEKAIAQYSEPFFEATSKDAVLVADINHKSASIPDTLPIKSLIQPSTESPIKSSVNSSNGVSSSSNYNENEDYADSRFSYYVETNLTGMKCSDSDISTVCDVVEHIIHTESPIHFEFLCKRIAPLFGNKVVTSKIRTKVTESLEMLSEIEQIDKFLFATDFNQIKPRIAKYGEPSRPIAYVSSQELMQAMIIVMSQNSDLNRDQIYLLISEAYQFNQSSTVRKILDSSYDLLLRKKMIVKPNNKK